MNERDLACLMTRCLIAVPRHLPRGMHTTSGRNLRGQGGPGLGVPLHTIFSRFETRIYLENLSKNLTERLPCSGVTVVRGAPTGRRAPFFLAHGALPLFFTNHATLQMRLELTTSVRKGERPG